MTDNETFYLTKSLIESGDVFDLSSIDGFKVDKHSTAALGIPVANEKYIVEAK